MTLLLYETTLLLFQLCPAAFAPARRSAAPAAGGAELSAAAAALLFGLHPLRVEVVAWCSCQPYALAGLLVAAALLLHARARALGAAGRGAAACAAGAASVGLFAAAVASKAAAVPAVLLHFALEATLLSERPPPAGAGRLVRPHASLPVDIFLLLLKSATAERDSERESIPQFLRSSRS